MSEHGMFWPLGDFSSMSKTGCCQNNGQSILKTNVSSGNQGKSYQRGEQWVIRGSGNLPLPVLIINIFLPFAIWSGIFNPKHLSLWCFYQMRYVGPVSPANPLFLFILEWNVSVVPWLFCLCFLQILLPLWPGSIPLCYLWLHLEHKFVGERRWFLSPHNHLLLSALERTWKNSYLSTVQVSP